MFSNPSQKKVKPTNVKLFKSARIDKWDLVELAEEGNQFLWTVVL